MRTKAKSKTIVKASKNFQLKKMFFFSIYLFKTAKYLKAKKKQNSNVVIIYLY